MHAPKTELRLQWIAIICMAIGLVSSTYYHNHTLQAERIESELHSYLHLNERYHQLLFTLIKQDHEIFKKCDDASLGENKYTLYEMIELFSTVELLEKYFQELDKNVWPCWDQQMSFFFEKPAVRYAWEARLKYADQIYRSSFIDRVQAILARSESEEPKI